MLTRWAICVAIGLALIVTAYAMGRRHGVEALEAALAADRVRIIKDGKEIDSAVQTLDRDGLCAVLGGCAVPDDTVSD